MIGQLDASYIRTRPFKLWSRLVSYGLFEGRPLTTRGRWINPLIFALFAVEQRLPRLRPVRKPVFIIGTGRSGTTILGLLLSMHREVGFLNEPKALWHAVYPYEDLIGSYCRGQALYRLPAEAATAEVVRRAHRLYGAYLFATGSRRVVDKYPELVFRISFVRRIFPDARFLFLVRNGWDTCHSIDLWSKRLGMEAGQEVHDWWGANDRKWHLLADQLVAGDPLTSSKSDLIRSLTRHTDRAATEWILTMREGMRLCQEHPDFVRMVRYEELAIAPERELRAIMDFCELPEDRKALKFGLETLSPAPSKQPFPLAEPIREAFALTMVELGYEAKP